MRSQFLVMTESHGATEGTALTIQHWMARWREPGPQEGTLWVSEMERARSTGGNALGQ